MGIGDPTKVTADEITALTIPKLFITTENDRSAGIPKIIVDMYDMSTEPKRLRVFPGEVHGTEMFNQDYGDEFTAELFFFVENLP